MAQDYSAIFPNQKMAEEISALALKMSSNNNNNNKKPRGYYSRDTLLDISSSPLTLLYSNEFVRNLKSHPDLWWIEDIERGKNTNSLFSKPLQFRNRERPDDRYQKITKTNIHKNSPTNWRSNNNTDQRYDRLSRNNPPLQKSRNHQNNGRYSMRNNGYDDDEEEEPEWLTGGPDSMMDFIELKGFDDDPLVMEENILSSTENLSVASDRPNSTTVSDYSDMTANTGDHKKNAMFPNPNNGGGGGVHDLFNDFSKQIFPDGNHGSSRATKWFKRSSTDAGQMDCVKPTPTSNGTAESVQNLMQKMMASSSGQPTVSQPRIDLSKATSLADIEANMLNSIAKAPTAQPEVLTKLMNMASGNNGVPQSQPRPPVQPVLPQGFPMDPSSMRPQFEQVNPQLLQQLWTQQMARAQNIRPGFLPPGQPMQPFCDPTYINMVMQRERDLQQQFLRLRQEQLKAQFNFQNQQRMSAQAQNLSPKPEEITRTEKLFKNSKFTPTSVFRKQADQKPKPIEKMEPVNQMFQQLNLNNRNNMTDAPMNPLSMLSSLSNGVAPNLPMPQMTGRVFTLDDLEK